MLVGCEDGCEIQPVSALQPAQLLAQMELLQHQLDLAREALKELDPAQLQNEIDSLSSQLAEARGVERVKAPEPLMPPQQSQAAAKPGSKPAMKPTAKPATTSTAKPAAIESATDVVARMQAMMEAVEATPESESTVNVMARAQAMMGRAMLEETQEVMEKEAAADDAATEQTVAAAQAETLPLPTESAADMVARTHAMIEQATMEQATAPAGATLPSARMTPIAVVRAQLHSLQSGEPHCCFHLNSPLARRLCPNAELFGETLRLAPTLRPLVRGSRYDIHSVLSVTPRTWQCRVSVDGFDYRWHLSQQQEQTLDVGTVVQHKQAEYVGVVVGWDDVCRRPEEWCQLMGVDALPRGRAQPFYLVLVASAGANASDDAPVDLESFGDLQISYVAQDLIQPRDPRAPVDHPQQTPLVLPGSLFTGEVDEAAGTWEPTPFLRAVYPRGVEGCWLVDWVTPDEPPQELASGAIGARRW